MNQLPRESAFRGGEPEASTKDTRSDRSIRSLLEKDTVYVAKFAVSRKANSHRQATQLNGDPVA